MAPGSTRDPNTNGHARATGSPGQNVTMLLARASSGDSAATNELFPLVYDELRRLAASHLAEDRPGHTLQPTALVNEAYLRLVGPGDVRWENRAHFFGAAARAIRRILTDHARARGRLKRGGGQARSAVDVAELSTPAPNIDLVALDEALERLSQIDSQKAKVVELRFYGGLTGDEAARALGVSPATAARDWQFARVWLHRELSKGDVA